jgi:heme exporter protein D
MNKKGVLLLFLLLIPILLLVNVSAKTSCAIRTVENCTGENGVIVFRLSGITNAHGEVFDLENYEYALCCDDNTLNHGCDGSNTILKLSSSSNAHAEINTLSNYNTDICLEEIECRTTNIPSTWQPILSLSSETNAHIGGPADYPVEIYCNVSYWGTYCGDGIIQEPNDLDFYEQCDEGENNGKEGVRCNEYCLYTQANLPYIHWADEPSSISDLPTKDVIVGTTKVYMRIGNAEGYDGVSVNDTVKFEIYEEDSGWLQTDDNIRTGADAIIGTWDGNGNVVAEWTISKSDVDKTENDYEEFYFKTNISGEEESGYLNLSVSEVLNCNLVFMCGDYTTQSDCQADANLCNVAAYNVEANNPDLSCSDEVACSCVWDASEGVCEPFWGGSNGNCTYYTTRDDDCDDGFLYYLFNAIWQGGEDPLKEKCKSGQSTVPCPSDIQLTGFDIVNIILVILLLVLIYLLINSIKRRKGSIKKEEKAQRKKPARKKSAKKLSSKKSKRKK